MQFSSAGSPARARRGAATRKRAAERVVALIILFCVVLCFRGLLACLGSSDGIESGARGRLGLCLSCLCLWCTVCGWIGVRGVRECIGSVYRSTSKSRPKGLGLIASGKSSSNERMPDGPGSRPLEGRMDGSIGGSID